MSKWRIVKVCSVIVFADDPPQYHLCELPIQNPKAGDVYIVKAPSVALGK